MKQYLVAVAAVTLGLCGAVYDPSVLSAKVAPEPPRPTPLEQALARNGDPAPDPGRPHNYAEARSLLGSASYVYRADGAHADERATGLQGALGVEFFPYDQRCGCDRAVAIVQGAYAAGRFGRTEFLFRPGERTAAYVVYGPMDEAGRAEVLAHGDVVPQRGGAVAAMLADLRGGRIASADPDDDRSAMAQAYLRGSDAGG